jgi:hypothetical protein
MGHLEGLFQECIKDYITVRPPILVVNSGNAPSKEPRHHGPPANPVCAGKYYKNEFISSFQMGQEEKRLIFRKVAPHLQRLGCES